MSSIQIIKYSRIILVAVASELFLVMNMTPILLLCCVVRLHNISLQIFCFNYCVIIPHKIPQNNAIRQYLLAHVLRYFPIFSNKGSLDKAGHYLRFIVFVCLLVNVHAYLLGTDSNVVAYAIIVIVAHKQSPGCLEDESFMSVFDTRESHRACHPA